MTLIDRLRNPDHTGDRRCRPCTAVNALVLLLACAAVARRRSRLAAAIVGAVGAAAIALRGYLVPFTPRFAPRLAARVPGDPFHAAAPADAPDAPEASDSLGAKGDGERVLAALVEDGVVVPDGETLRLDDAFRERWRAETRTLRERDDEELRAALDAAAPDGCSVEAVAPGGRRWFVVSDGSGDPAAEQWLARPVAVADAAAVRALGDATARPRELRAQAARPLRTLLSACPVCDGPVEETTSVDCCGGPGGARATPDEVLACADCGARLYTF